MSLADRHRLVSLAAAAAALLLPCLTAAAEDSAAILGRLRETLGGDAVRSSRMEFTIREEGREGPPIEVRLITARPDRMRMFQSGGRGDSEIGFDGARGWMSDSRGGFLPLDAETARLMSRGADLQALPRTLRERFERFEVAPPSEFDGRPSQPLVAYEESGEAARIHLDPASGLPLGIEHSEETPEGVQHHRILFSGWRREGETMVFARAEIVAGRRRSIVEFSRVRFNEVADAEFAPPAAIAEAPGGSAEAQDRAAPPSAAP